MPNVTVRCPQCTLEKSFDDTGIIPADWKNTDGELVCPNCAVPMKPIGEGQVLAAEEAFKVANAQPREGQATAAPVENEDTLRKRLADIRAAKNEVESRLAVWEEAKKDAADAKKHYDAAVSTLLTITERLTRVPTAADDLPLFSPQAEQAAQSDTPPEAYHVSSNDDALLRKLADAGAGVTANQLTNWTSQQRIAAWEWATREGTVESMPEHVALASTEPDATIDAADTQVDAVQQ